MLRTAEYIQNKNVNNSLGERCLNLQFITSMIREKLFSICILSLLLTLLVELVVFVLTRNEQLIYQFLRDDCHCTTSILSFLIFLFIRTVFVLELTATCFLNISAMYICYCSMHFWLKRTWYFRNT